MKPFNPAKLPEGSPRCQCASRLWARETAALSGCDPQACRRATGRLRCESIHPYPRRPRPASAGWTDRSLVTRPPQLITPPTPRAGRTAAPTILASYGPSRGRIRPRSVRAAPLILLRGVARVILAGHGRWGADGAKVSVVPWSIGVLRRVRCDLGWLRPLWGPDVAKVCGGRRGSLCRGGLGMGLCRGRGVGVGRVGWVGSGGWEVSAGWSESIVGAHDAETLFLFCQARRGYFSESALGAAVL